ncbi:hypothetical protein [Larsenimonas suaedae]|uniref:Uncharacterized protein n=1 Tax=Larsenimonas suaedae TaxID=1851019 RepID=A0ABU1GZ34_9GAMM|nr:hypothetical protein [Larsenimonas suaedae]MCM2973777.1 hypothetical protein [Larsenimonas suaedae]MDR5897301.1 hypothetical protein [Larsenimonas suaedae]
MLTEPITLLFMSPVIVVMLTWIFVAYIAPHMKWFKALDREFGIDRDKR